MAPAVKEQIRKKFEISFMLAKEHIPFSKYSVIHELEEKHGVDLGSTYKNRDAPRNFLHYHMLSSEHFYSILMDGSTDKGRVENELFVILFCDIDDEIQEVKTSARYLCVVEPLKADAKWIGRLSW